MFFSLKRMLGAALRVSGFRAGHNGAPSTPAPNGARGQDGPLGCYTGVVGWSNW